MSFVLNDTRMDEVYGFLNNFTCIMRIEKKIAVVYRAIKKNPM